jgi:hypothetical protein
MQCVHCKRSPAQDFVRLSVRLEALLECVQPTSKIHARYSFFHVEEHLLLLKMKNIQDLIRNQTYHLYIVMTTLNRAVFVVNCLPAFL